jgi:hypothetical protein
LVAASPSAVPERYGIQVVPLRLATVTQAASAASRILRRFSVVSNHHM